ncbi:ATPase [Arsenicicoccus sp. oral taxon 190]|nr:ATPase [Arsenicicoccus sp. oral taxon 190]
MPRPPARPAATPAAAAPAPTPAPPSNAASFGRVAEDGTVYVRTPDGEKPVGSYPGASAEEALAYFARKYDEMWAAADLLYHRVLQTGLSAKEASDDLGTLREHIGEANVVGDLPELDAKVESIATAIEARKQVEATERAAAREQARAEREAIVAEAEQIAAQDPAKTQWKASGARIRELLEDWKKHQRSSAKLDRESENSLWQRFSAARNSFDKARRVYFAELESTQSDAKEAKEKLVAEAEKLATSKEWGSTAGAFKRLMDQWRRAGRAGRKDDDALWARFKAAQDSFFNAKDEIAAEEDKEFRANLEVKEGLLTEAKALLPIKDLQATKAQLRTIQDKWDAAGKVPRSEMGRIEGELRKVEQTVRDAEDARWKKSNPEVNHRATAFAEQIERALEKENKALDKARASGDEKKIKAAEESLASRRALLEMVHKAQS